MAQLGHIFEKLGVVHPINQSPKLQIGNGLGRQRKLDGYIKRG